jgi:hypothetical protein
MASIFSNQGNSIETHLRADAGDTNYGTNTSLTIGSTTIAFREKRAWTESGATWNKYDGANAWGTAGSGNTTSDIEASDIGNVSVTDALPDGTEVKITLTPSKVQEWVSGVFANNGLLLKVDTEDSDAYLYASHENATANLRPKLVIEYTTPGGFFALL